MLTCLLNKCNLGDAGVQTPCQRCNEKGLQSECTGLELTEKAQARKRKLAATDIDNDKTCEYLPLEVFWLERLMKYSKSALTIHWETWDLLDREYYEPPKVVEVLKQIEENRALVGSRVKTCANTPSLANSLDFLSKFSNTYYSWDTEREVKLGFQPHWFIGETETTFPKPRPHQQANLALHALRVQESRLLQDSSLLSEESELSAYAQKYSEVMHYLRTIAKCTMPPLPWTHNLLSLIEVRQQRRLLISKFPAIEEKDMFGRSLLHLALDLGVGDDAVHLLSSAANEPDAWGRLPLHIASFTGCIDLTTRLIYDQTEIQMEDNCGLQPLHYASAAGHVDIVNLLISKAEIDPEDSHGRTPLIYGVMNGHIATASVLLENGADIESYEWSWTPLLYAINGGRVGIVDLLLRKGADVEPMMETETFMSHPLRRKHLGVIELLLERGAVEEIRRFSDENLLLWAANKGHHRLIRQLIFHKEFQTPISTNGITALSYASEEGNHEIVVELLENGVDPNERCNGRELPLSYAVARGHVSVTKELLKHDANPNAKSGIDMDGQMILVNAFELRNPDIIDHLVAWGADVSANGSRG
ncbi:Ankyrin repeat [Fusarium oxysporum f. sp. vasinfectum]|nr:Ankyrin repeat [Fusarium oxysporum f. sp. vasinfectum]KAK2925461.1 Ankyrin repeat [Fusarium oxysporum f. sp. vasinfectum]